MNLAPQIPPGRSNRKAREYSAEIARLRMAGYGCRAIREALAEVGVVVSKSTVHRELAKLPKSATLSRPAFAIQHASPAATHSVVSQLVPAQAAPSPPPTDRRSSKEIAEAFMKSQITNPLLRNKMLKQE